MKKLGFVIIVFLVIFFLSYYFLNSKSKSQGNIKVEKSDKISVNIQPNTNKNMKLTSSVFENNTNIPSKYSCGNGASPPLTISGVPEQAKSLALIMDDPDAPGGTWVHWVMWNIDPEIKGISENEIPLNAMKAPPHGLPSFHADIGINSYRNPRYDGPCPPSGVHRYFFKLYALDTTPVLPKESKKEDLEKAMEGHILDKAELVGLYSRK